MLTGFVRVAGLILLLVLATMSTWAQLPLIEDADGSPTLAPLLKRVTPSVVNVAVVGQIEVRRNPSFDNPLFDDPLFDRFFDLPTQPDVIPQQGIGSGVIIDAENGYVITNHHVIEVADEIAVTLADGRRMDAELVGSDPETDIALLRIPADDLTAIPLGGSDELEVGDFVIAIGNPFGLGQTVTSGIVSALRRGGLNIEGYEDFIQTDASINRGNSGGALVDIHGALVGINTAIVSPVGGSVGIGFAIPINMAREATGGAIITQVEPDSPAEGAGLRAGDVIVEFNGNAVAGSSDLRNKVGLVPLGATVNLVYLRDGRREKVDATIGRSATDSPASRANIDRLSGADFAELDRSDPGYRDIEGVLVTRLEQGSPAARSGLQPGDVIMAVNRASVRTVAELARALNAAEGGAGTDSFARQQNNFCSYPMMSRVGK